MAVALGVAQTDGEEVAAAVESGGSGGAVARTVRSGGACGEERRREGKPAVECVRWLGRR